MKAADVSSLRMLRRASRGMITGISIVSVWVLDQDSAKEFYADKLGRRPEPRRQRSIAAGEGRAVHVVSGMSLQ